MITIQTTLGTIVPQQKKKPKVHPTTTHKKNEKILLEIPFTEEEYELINQTFKGNPLREPKDVYLRLLIKESFMELVENTKNNQFKTNQHDFTLNNGLEHKLQVMMYTWEKQNQQPMDETTFFKKIILKEWNRHKGIYEKQEQNFKKLIKKIKVKQ